MAKPKEKRPRATGLNERQREIVAKHQYRNALKRAMQTGTPKERAEATYKYYYDFTDIQFENGRELIEKTPEYKRIWFRFKLEAAVLALPERLKQNIKKRNL